MVKYYLKDGTQLSTYCNNHGLVYDSVLYRIQQGMTPDEAVTVPFKKCETRLVHGKNMAQYCRENGYNYGYLHSKWKQMYNDMPVEEFLDRYLNGELRKSKGGLKQYCEEKGYNYRNIYTLWYKKYSDRYSFKQYVEMVDSGITKTSLEFIPASVYCRQHGYDYVKLHNLYQRTKHRCYTFKDFIKKWESDNGYSCETS